MEILVLNAYHKWTELYGHNVPRNLISVERMLKRWKIKRYDEITSRFLLDKKLGPKTFNDRLAILKRFIKWSLKHKYVRKDPLEDVERRKQTDVSSKRDPYSDAELLILLKHFEETPLLRERYLPFLKFLILTGVRNGEATGLKVNMVDFINREIHISKSFSRTYSGKRILKSPKTVAGNRYIPLTAPVEELLLPLLAKKSPGDFIFTSCYGNPIDDRQFQQRIFKPVLKKLKLPVRDLYACRHTFGTIAVEQNIDILSVAYLMGHKKPRTVLEHYTKLRTRPKILPNITLK